MKTWHEGEPGCWWWRLVWGRRTKSLSVTVAWPRYWHHMLLAEASIGMEDVGRFVIAAALFGFGIGLELDVT